MDTNDIVEDTYAEAFRSIYAEVLITARDRKWLDHCLNAVTGHASSTIMCDCEAGVDRYVEGEATPREMRAIRGEEANIMYRQWELHLSRADTSGENSRCTVSASLRLGGSEPWPGGIPSHPTPHGTRVFWVLPG